MKKILVIKLSAFGDFIQALGAMRAIRAHHKNDEITLLTTKPFVHLAKECGYFDRVWVDEKPKALQLGKWLAWRKKLNAEGFNRVYDLQNNDRAGLYFHLMKPKPEWVGTVKGASHRNTKLPRGASHAIERHKETLRVGGIENVEIDNLSWIETDISRFGLVQPYVLLIPGCAPDRPEKQWPRENFAEIARRLAQAGIQPVLIGAKDEEEINACIELICPSVNNLTNQTAMLDLPSLARGAAGAVGNDTGPMHMIAATGCPSLTLFGPASDATLHAPRGRNTSVISVPALENLKPDVVWQRLKQLNVIN